MEAKNITGIVTTATQATAQAVPKTPAQRMNGFLTLESTRKIMEGTLRENADAFTASIIDLYNGDKYLQQCQPAQVFGEALKAVSLKLPINKQLGFAYIIPYKGIATFQLGYKGYIQLCQRTGAYKYINAGMVYEGEITGTDKLTGMVDLSGARKSDTIIGYFAYIETLNGFKKALYWTRDDIVSHAKKYSQSYKQGAAIWRDHFDEMAIKTVLRNLLAKWGVMSVDMERAYNAENADMADAAISGVDSPAADYTLDAETGEISENMEDDKK